ncbi:MAG: hypothetical protein ACN6NN_07440, partial [Acinetobacter calcoaceticus]
QPAERLLTDLLDKAKKEANQPNPLYQPPSSTSSAATSTSTPTTPPSTAPSDAKPADSVQVNPAHPPVNKPFGSTGENDEI